MSTTLRRISPVVPGADLVQALALLVVIPVVLQGRDDVWTLSWAVPAALVAAVAHVLVLTGAAAVSPRDPRSWARLAVPVATVAGSGVLSHHGVATWSLLCIMGALQVSQLLEVSAVPVGIAVVAIASVPLVTVAKPWPFGLLVFVSALIAWLRRRLMLTIEQLQDARDALAVAAVEAERQRFSRDLHDLLGHTLSVIVVAAQVVAGTVRTRPEFAIETAVDIEDTGRRALREVRAAVDGYRSASLSAALAGARFALSTAGIELSWHTDEPRLRPEAEELIGWVLREGTTNVVRHSNATHCVVGLTGGARGPVTLTLTDDGTADPDAVRRAEAGLTGLRQRVAAVGGTLTVALAEPSGFALQVVVPEETP